MIFMSPGLRFVNDTARIAKDEGMSLESLRILSGFYLGVFGLERMMLSGEKPCLVSHKSVTRQGLALRTSKARFW